MTEYGLLGEKLGHSYSPRIHRELGGYDYGLFPTAPEDVGAFLRSGSFRGLNVTIPYKKTVVPYCAELSPTAKALGSVNTVVRRPDGSLYGDNTDHYGFSYLLRSAGIRPAGKKALVLGSGGASVTVKAVLEAAGAKVTVISRRGEDNYENLSRHGDAELIVNATPVGMYPDNGRYPADLRRFPACRTVVDLIYNPARTALMLQAEELGIPAFGGLSMLVAQAKASAELFLGKDLDDSRIGDVTRRLAAATENIILIGMPGCGKSTVAALLGTATDREVLDCDEEIVRRAGRSIPEIFAKDGEEAFRRLETEVLTDFGKQSGKILATGGGCVTKPENRPLLHQNGTIFWLRRDVGKLPVDGRPISQRTDPARLYEIRAPLYRSWADHEIGNDGAAEDAVREIMEAMS